MRTKMKFISKVTVAHFVTYFICGVLFSKLFNYETLFKLGNAKYFMRDFYHFAKKEMKEKEYFK